MNQIIKNTIILFVITLPFCELPGYLHWRKPKK